MASSFTSCCGLDLHLRIGKIAEDGSNWVTCKARFITMVKARRLSKYLDGTATPPAPISKKRATEEEETKYRDEFEEFEARNAQVVELIHAMANEPLMVEIQMLEKAKEVWGVVCRRYEENDGFRSRLWNMLDNMRLHNSANPEEVRAHFTELRRIRNLLKSMDTDVGDAYLIRAARISLPEAFDAFLRSDRVADVTEGEGRNADAFFDIVQEYAECRFEDFPEPQPQAGGNRSGSGRGKRGGRKECLNCGRFGHLADDCWAEGGGREGQGPGGSRNTR